MKNKVENVINLLVTVIISDTKCIWDLISVSANLVSLTLN